MSEPRLRIYSEEEIQIFLQSERRVVDGLVLQSLNDLAIALIPHMQKMDDMVELHGHPEAVRARVEWVNTQISKQQARTRMMNKVAESTLGWAFIAFLGFVCYSAWEHFVAIVKARN